MKKYEAISVTWWILLAAMSIFFFYSNAFAGNFDYSIGVNAGYSTGELTNGVNIPPLGEASDTVMPLSIVGRVIYSKYPYKPVFEIAYKESSYSFATSRATVTLDPREYSFRVGVIKEVYGIDLLALVGYSYYRGNLQVIERLDDGTLFKHGGTIGNVQHTPSMRLGLSKTIPLTEKTRWGIETGIEYYFFPREYDYCMKFAPSNLEPYVGFKFEF